MDGSHFCSYCGRQIVQNRARGQEVIYPLLAMLFIIAAIVIFMVYRALEALLLGMIAEVAVLVVGWYTRRTAH